ncbi:HdeD family acid-resistance protein [Pseudooceanicola sp. LIPI14-2-Ac024]|uniref:HdeD family acid-resistance protein n=1 Tax=Pseudooceanicola sp. LIPI14-2-Ac024 TaxID=3344875 RepID=UPI0035CFBBEA
MRASSMMLALGIILILAGIFALFNPLAASVAVTTIVGIVLLVAGGISLLAMLVDGSFGARLWSIVIAALSVIAGFWLLANPLQGTISLTVIVGAIIFVIGLVRLLMVGGLRGLPSFWPVLLSGLFSIGIGLLVLFGFAELRSTMLGYLLGIELVAEGVALAALGYFGRKEGV